MLALWSKVYVSRLSRYYRTMKKKILNIKLHNMPTKGTNIITAKLCEELNNSETKYPGTDYTMRFGLVSN